MDIVTDRLRLRAIQVSDAEDLLKCYCDDEIANLACFEAIKTLKQAKSAIKKYFSKTENLWAITLKRTDRLIGTIGLYNNIYFNVSNSKSLGFELAREHWGKGYATEAANAVIEYAFNKLQINLVVALHLWENERSKRVIEKCGFEYKGEFQFPYSNLRLKQLKGYILKRQA